MWAETASNNHWKAGKADSLDLQHFHFHLFHVACRNSAEADIVWLPAILIPFCCLHGYYSVRERLGRMVAQWLQHTVPTYDHQLGIPTAEDGGSASCWPTGALPMAFGCPLRITSVFYQEVLVSITCMAESLAAWRLRTTGLEMSSNQGQGWFFPWFFRFNFQATILCHQFGSIWSSWLTFPCGLMFRRQIMRALPGNGWPKPSRHRQRSLSVRNRRSWELGNDIIGCW